MMVVQVFVFVTDGKMPCLKIAMNAETRIPHAYVK